MESLKANPEQSGDAKLKGPCGDWWIASCQMLLAKTIPMKKSPAKLKIVCATSMVVFSLFAAFAGSIAWFSAAQNVSDGADGFGIGRGDISITSYSIIKYDWNGKAAIDATEEEDPLALNAYDCIFTSRNSYNSIYVYVTLDAASTGTLNLATSCTGDLYADSAIASYVSNVVGFKAVSASEVSLSYDGTNPASFYESAQTAFASVSDTTFITSADSTLSKSTSIALIDDIEITETGSFSIIMEIDYDADLLTQYFDSNNLSISDIGLSDVVGGNAIDFDSDVSSFTFSLGSAS